jgi:hypothetical protein
MMLLLVSVAVWISSQRAESGRQRTEVGGQRSEVRNQPVTRLLRLPVLTRVGGQIDAQGNEQLSADAIQALLREVEARHKEANAKLEHYSYLLKRTKHQLNDERARARSTGCMSIGFFRADRVFRWRRC